jgi:hypothetical protein
MKSMVFPEKIIPCKAQKQTVDHGQVIVAPQQIAHRTKADVDCFFFSKLS